MENEGNSARARSMGDAISLVREFGVVPPIIQSSDLGRFSAPESESEWLLAIMVLPVEAIRKRVAEPRCNLSLWVAYKLFLINALWCIRLVSHAA
jgi:hypothetical protein